MAPRETSIAPVVETAGHEAVQKVAEEAGKEGKASMKQLTDRKDGVYRAFVLQLYTGDMVSCPVSNFQSSRINGPTHKISG